MSTILPHGAKGIQAAGFAVAFGDDKIVFTVKQRSDGDSSPDVSERHYTFHAGLKSGIIDVHETRSRPDGHKEHKTLFALSAVDLPPILQSLAPMLPELVGLFRPLRIGWMKHRNIGVARGIEPIGDADVEAVTVKRKRKLSVDPERYLDNVLVPEYLEEIYDFPDGNFALFHRNRNIGIGFKKTGADGRVRLFWIKRHDLMRFGNEWQERVINALNGAAIPAERYAEYLFLRA